MASRYYACAATVLLFATAAFAKCPEIAGMKVDISGTWKIDTVHPFGGAAGTIVQIVQQDSADGCDLTATSAGAKWSPAQGKFGGPPDNRFGMKFGTLEYIGMADRYGTEYSEINWYQGGSIETGFGQSVGKWIKQQPPAPPINCPDISGAWMVDTGMGGAPGTMVQMAQHDHDNHCDLTATSAGAIWSPAQGSFDGPPDNRFVMSFYDGRAGTLEYIGMASASQITWFETGFDKPVGNWTKQVGSYVEEAVSTPCHEILESFLFFREPICLEKDLLSTPGSCEDHGYSNSSCTSSGWSVCCRGQFSGRQGNWSGVWRFKTDTKCSDLHDGGGTYAPC